MGFWSFFEVASMPIVEVLVISLLGAFMATDYCKLLPVDTRRSLNKIVFVVFTPCLMFASLAKTVTFHDIIAWWFMPINIGLTFLFGGILGWLVVKILKPRPQLEGLVIAACSSGNLGNLPLIIIPAICDEEGSPFGEQKACRSIAFSYASFSMAIGGFYLWTYTYQVIRASSVKFKAINAASVKSADVESSSQTYLLLKDDQQKDDQEPSESESNLEEKSLVYKLKDFLHLIVDELFAPPTIGAILGFVFGATNQLKNLIIGENAPLRVIQDSIQLLGNGTIPCITLILGGNLFQGLRSSKMKPSVIIGVIVVRYVMLPLIGLWVVKGAAHFGFLPPDPFFRYVLLIQFTLPPAVNISTMTQLFDVAQDECSVLFLWTYLVAALALTVWSTIFMSILV